MDEFILVGLPTELSLSDLRGGLKYPVRLRKYFEELEDQVLWPPKMGKTSGRLNCGGLTASCSRTVGEELRSEVNQNLLFFPEPLSQPGIDIQPEGRDGIRYTRLDQLEDPSSILNLPGVGTVGHRNLLRHFAVSAAQDAAKGVDYYSIKLSEMGTDGDNNVLLNPIVLRMDIDGDDLTPAAANITGIRKNLKTLAESSHAFPVFSQQANLRHRLFEILGQKGQASGDRTRIFQLFFTDGDPVPFLALDGLSGKFVLRTPESSWGWVEPEKLGPNGCWFRDYFMNLWHGTAGADRVIPTASNWSPIPPDPRPTGLKTSQLGAFELIDRLSKREQTSGEDNVMTFLADACDSLRVDRLTWPGADLLSPFFAGSSGDNLDELRVDVSGILEQIGRQLLPTSDVLIAFPDTEQFSEGQHKEAYRKHLSGRGLALLDSVEWPGRRFVERLLARKAPQYDGWPLKFRAGWWKDFYDGLFLEDANTPFGFTFDAVRTFRLGKEGEGSRLSSLPSGDLLGAVDLYSQEPNPVVRY